MKEEVTKVDQVEAMISTQLSQFEVKEEDLKEKVAEYSLLVVTGIDDKAGRKAVSEARKHLKSLRTGITNTGKDLRENFNKVSKAIIARQNDLIAITQPEEERLELIEKDIAEEEEELRQQKEYEEQQRIIARTKELEGYGATFNGVQYELGDHVLTMAEVRLFTDTEFNRAATFFKEEFENFEQLKLQAEIDRQTNLTNNKEAAILYIQSLGYVFDKDSFYNADFKHRFVTIRDLETEEDLRVFKMEMDNIANHFKEAKEKAEAQRIADEALKAEQERLSEIQKAQDLKQAELDRKQKELDEQLAAVKAQKEADEKRAKQLEYDAKVNLFESRRTQLINTPNLVQKDLINSMDTAAYSYSDEEWNDFLVNCKHLFEKNEEQLKKEAEEKAAAEEKRRIEMAPDVELLQGVIDKLKKVTGARPAMKTAKGAAVLSNTDILIGKTITYIEAQIKNL